MPLQQSMPPIEITLTQVAAAISIVFGQPQSFEVTLNPFGGGGNAKLPFFDSRTAIPGGVPCDSVTNASVQAQAAIDTISANGGGILYMVGDNPASRFYLNGSVWARDRVIVVWVNEILFGNYGRLGVGGSADDGVAFYFLTADALTGTNLLPVRAQDFPALLVGDVLEVRGQNDATGIALERQRVTVTARNAGTNTLTVTPPLQFDFLAAYPLSQVANDKTTIKKLVQSPLVTLAEGSLDIVVANAALFGINDVVCIEDSKLCSDVVPGSSANQIHMETNIVRNIDAANNIVTLMLPLAHTYEAPFGAKMIRTNPARHAGHINPRIHYAVQSDTNSQHAMLFLYAAFCNVSGLRVMGDPNVNPALSLGNRGHGCRMSDGSIGNVVFDTVIHRPAFWAAGQGYGVTCYNGARANTYKKVQANGCRHSVLFFKGTTDNYVEDVTSIDCRISDVDFHGANETRNIVHGVKVVGGSSTAPDSATKASAKFGNPTHQVGPRGNVVRNLDITNGQDYAVQFLPSFGNTVENITGTSAKGCQWKYDTGTTTLLMRDNWVHNAQFNGGTKHVECDGGPNKVIANCGIRDGIVRDAPMTGTSFDLANAASFTLNDCATMRAGVDVSSYHVQAIGINDLRINRFRGDGAKRFLMLQNCPNALVDSPSLSNLSERVIVYDAGGNDNARIFGIEATGFDPAFVDAAAGSAGIKYTPRRTMQQFTQAALGAVTFTTATNQIAIANAVPAATAGSLILQSAAVKPRIPKGVVSFRATFPYVSVDLTNTHTATLYYRQNGGAWTFAGLSVGRITGGATAGQAIILTGRIVHSLQDLSGTLEFMLRIGNASAAAVTSIGQQFGGKDQPYLEIAEQVDA
jgi:hypothetical protein